MASNLLIFPRIDWPQCVKSTAKFGGLATIREPVHPRPPPPPQRGTATEQKVTESLTGDEVEDGPDRDAEVDRLIGDVIVVGDVIIVCAVAVAVYQGAGPACSHQGNTLHAQTDGQTDVGVYQGARPAYSHQRNTLHAQTDGQAHFQSGFVLTCSTLHKMHGSSSNLCSIYSNAMLRPGPCCRQGS